MMVMLQTRCKNSAKAASSSTKSDGSENGNQALHLLSEVAMGNSGSARGDKEEQEQNGGIVEDSFVTPKHPANAFVNKLLGMDDKELLNKETWFEELIQDFQ